MRKASVLTIFTAGALFVGATHTFADEHSAEDILNQSNEAMDNLESFSSTIEMEQSISEAEGDFNTVTTIEQDLILDPLKLRQETTTMMPDGAGEETLMSYWTEEGFFQEDGTGGWLKLEDGEQMEEMMYEPGDQINELEAWSDDLELAEEDGYYVVSYSGEGGDFTEMLAQLEDIDGEEEEMMEEMMGELDVDEISYELHIDQDTYYTTHATVDMQMSLEADGMSISMDQSIDMEFHNFDSVEDFDLPDGVAEEAEDLDDMLEDELDELDEMEEDGDEMAATATNYPLWTGVGLLFLVTAGGVLLTGRKPEKA